jgi:hypothetical protein
MSNLTKIDYIKILKYYNLTIPKSYKLVKNKASTILTQKLCRCIKKLEPKYKNRSIGTCKKSVLHKKNLTAKTHSCKKKTKTQFQKYN